MRKIINRNLPEEGANGQYNFDETLENISVDGQQSLYSLVEQYGDNISNILDYRFIDTITFSIEEANIILTDLGNTASYENDFRIYLIDDQRNNSLNLDSEIIYNEESHTITYNTNAYDRIDSAVKGELGRWYDNLDAGEHFGCAGSWYPGDVTNWEGSNDNNECEIWDLSEGGWIDWNAWLQYPGNDPDSDPWFDTLTGFPYDGMITTPYELDYSQFISNNFPRSQGKAYYIAIWTKAHDCDGTDQDRKQTYTIYRIDKNLLYKVWSHPTRTSLEIKFTGNTYIDNFEADGSVTYPAPPYVDGGYGLSPKYKGGDLRLQFQLESSKNFEQRTNWADLQIGDYSKLHINNPIDYQFIFDYNGNYINSDDVFDFRPISFVAPRQTWMFDLQQFYEFGDGYIATTAPNQVNLSFRIAEADTNWFPYYLDGYDDNTSNLNNIDIVLGDSGDLDLGINFMMYVYDWEGQDMEFDWNHIISDFPTTYSDLVFKQRLGTYQFEQLFKSNDGTYWELGSIPHQYSTSGVHIIKAVIFSYAPASYVFPGTTENLGSYITPLRWKAVNIKVNMGYDLSYIEDFADVGGFDYTYIPWPETTAVVSGISEDSSYVNAVKEIIQKNLFAENEYADYSISHLAYENIPGRKKDELGDYLGKVDIGQIRYFDKPYDMNDLLMLPVDNGFVRYDEWDEWYDFDIYPNNPQYPRNENDEVNSCVGLLFIKDDMDISRMESCTMELNFKAVNGITVRDTSGNDNRGLLLGDYVVEKPDYNIRLNREEAPEMPEINSEKLAF